MLKVGYKPSFLRALNALDPTLQEEVIEKIELFKDRKNHPILRVHKLKGRLSGTWSFSVNFKYRIIFQYLDKKTALLLDIGDHRVYDE